MPYDPNFQAMVFPVLMEAFDTYLSDVYDGRLYANVQTGTKIFPYGIYQSADGGGNNADFVGQSGWEGDITFRSIHTTTSGAWDYLVQLSTQLVTLQASGIAGYSFKYKPQHPQWFPVEKLSTGNIYTAGLLVSFSVYKE